MNILFLNTTYICGGAESVASQILQGMSARGHLWEEETLL